MDYQKDPAAKLRGEIAEAGVPAYVVAAAARIHPSILSRLLRGRRPLNADLTQRIRAGIASQKTAGPR